MSLTGSICMNLAFLSILPPCVFCSCLFPLKVIIDRHILVSIVLIIFWLFFVVLCSFLLFLTYDLMAFFSVMFIFLFLSFLCMCYGFSVCGYHEFYV